MRARSSWRAGLRRRKSSDDSRWSKSRAPRSVTRNDVESTESGRLYVLQNRRAQRRTEADFGGLRSDRSRSWSRGPEGVPASDGPRIRRARMSTHLPPYRSCEQQSNTASKSRRTKTERLPCSRTSDEGSVVGGRIRAAREPPFECARISKSASSFATTLVRPKEESKRDARCTEDISS